MNSTNLKQVDGGTVIKQGDFSSNFAFELLDENNKVIELDDKEAIVTLESYDKEVFLEKVIKVEQGRVAFKIDEILPARTFTLEIKCDGYIFPSDRRVQIEVSKGSGEYVPKDPIGKILTEPEVIDLINQPEFINKVKGDKGEPGVVGSKGADGKDGIQGPQGDAGPTGVQGQKGDKGDNGDNGDTGQAGEPGKSAYQTWLGLGNSGSEQDFIDSLKPVITRYSPVGYSLDRTTTPWTIRLDNGCEMQLPSYPTTATIYGYGYYSTTDMTHPTSYPIPLSILRTSTGAISIENWKTSNSVASYWADDTRVGNPINDAGLYDFSNATYKPDDTDVLKSRQKNVIRVMYELGIWSEADILALGAVKK